MTDNDVTATVADLTLEEKASLTSGLNFWHTKPVERVGIPSIMMTDGPHGLRKQAGAGDHLGVGSSVPATCFPPAVGLGSSCDVELLAVFLVVKYFSALSLKVMPMSYVFRRRPWNASSNWYPTSQQVFADRTRFWHKLEGPDRCR